MKFHETGTDDSDSAIAQLIFDTVEYFGKTNMNENIETNIK